MGQGRFTGLERHTVTTKGNQRITERPHFDQWSSHIYKNERILKPGLENTQGQVITSAPSRDLSGSVVHYVKMDRDNTRDDAPPNTPDKPTDTWDYEEWTTEQVIEGIKLFNMKNGIVPVTPSKATPPTPPTPPTSPTPTKKGPKHRLPRTPHPPPDTITTDEETRLMKTIEEAPNIFWAYTLFVKEIFKIEIDLHIQQNTATQLQTAPKENPTEYVSTLTKILNYNNKVPPVNLTELAKLVKQLFYDEKQVPRDTIQHLTAGLSSSDTPALHTVLPALNIENQTDKEYLKMLQQHLRTHKYSILLENQSSHHQLPRTNYIHLRQPQSHE